MGLTTKTVPAQALGSGVTFPSVDKGASTGLSVELFTAVGSTNAGTLKLQGSNDNTNFADISGATVSVTTGSAAFMINLSQNYMRYVRAVYTQSSGAGNGTLIYHWPQGT